MVLADELAAAADPEMAPHVLAALRAAPHALPDALTELVSSEAAGPALVELRAALRRDRRRGADAATDADLDRALADTVRPMLRRDALWLRRVGPDAPEAMVNQIAEGDTVHPVRDDDDLRRRVAPDRRVLGLSLPGDDALLVFVEVALTHGLAGSMPELLDGAVDPEAERNADTATFWSINTAHPGARGLGIGRVLLEATIDALRDELGQLAVFTTLSPIPTFRSWVESAHPQAPADARLGLCARYLVETVDGRVRDPVGNFHLGNGARVERLCPGADPSPSGLERSFAIMVNYRYDPERLPERRAAYERGDVSRSPAVSLPS